MQKIPASFVAFDLETTGFAPPCRIIEIGAVKVVDNKVTEQFQTFVNPCCRLPSYITELTGIGDEMVKNEPLIEEALPLFLEFLGDFPMAAHNASFDMQFINHEMRKLGRSLSNPVIDTLALSRRCYPGLRNHKLATVAQHIGAVNQSAHRGMYDAMVVAEILLKLA